MSDLFVGQMHPLGSEGVDDYFKVESVITGEQAAGPAEETGCKLSYPS